MLCNHCKQRPAVVHLAMSNGVTTAEYDLCEDCARKITARYYGGFSDGMSSLSLLGGPWRLLRELASWDTGVNPAPPADPFGAGRIPAIADTEFQKRRHLGELHTQLERAVAEEDYETAARLRDEIAREQQE